MYFLSLRDEAVAHGSGGVFIYLVRNIHLHRQTITKRFVGELGLRTTTGRLYLCFKSLKSNRLLLK